MHNKVYQITVDEVLVKRFMTRISKSVTAHIDYAHSKNLNTWDDVILECLSDDLGNHWQFFEDHINELIDQAKGVKSDNT